MHSSQIKRDNFHCDTDLHNQTKQKKNNNSQTPSAHTQMRSIEYGSKWQINVPTYISRVQEQSEVVEDW